MKRLLINVLASVVVALLLRVLDKGGESMRAVYVALIVNGRMTIDNVAKPLQAVVLEDLKALGLDGQGKPLEGVA